MMSIQNVLRDRLAIMAFNRIGLPKNTNGSKAALRSVIINTRQSERPIPTSAGYS